MKSKSLSFIGAAAISGIAMWIVAGLWHNLILPLFDKNVHPHHEGLVLMLIAYFVLSLLMTNIYILSTKSGSHIINGLKIGIIVGILWVFPHGLAMAGVHNTSVIYEIKNTLWHVIEQGIGGIIIAIVLKNR